MYVITIIHPNNKYNLKPRIYIYLDPDNHSSTKYYHEKNSSARDVIRSIMEHPDYRIEIHKWSFI